MKWGFLFFASALAIGLAGCTQQDTNGDGQQEVVISAECSWQVGADCTLACDDFDFWFACEGDFEAECAPECDEFTLDVSCTGGCEASCSAECTDPGSFDCQGYCEGDCGANCEADCEASAGDGEAQAECSAHCDAFCEGNCSASCDIDLPDCTAACQASCEGECTADANFDCHLCDVDVYATCEGEMNLDCEGGCDVDGVLECNGEFISKEDLESAVAWVEENMTAEVTYDGSADCSGNSCSAEGSASITCAAAAPGRESAGGLLTLLASLF
jgi:hypothetical protein